MVAQPADEGFAAFPDGLLCRENQNVFLPDSKIKISHKDELLMDEQGRNH